MADAREGVRRRACAQQMHRETDNAIVAKNEMAEFFKPKRVSAVALGPQAPKHSLNKCRGA